MSYNLKDIWNGDKTDLVWKIEPFRVLARISLLGHKKEKSWVIIFCIANAIEIEKITLIFIYKYKSSHIMKNINYKNLSIYYFWNKKTWMQVSIFNELLLKLNKIMKWKNQKIIFLIDNVPVYFILDETQKKLDCLDVKFLSSNTTTEF